MVKSISWFLHNTSTKNNLFTEFRSIMCFTEIISTKFHDGRDHTRVLPSATAQLDVHRRSSQNAHIMSATLKSRQCQFRPYFKNSASALCPNANLRRFVGVCGSCHLITCRPKLCFKRVAVCMVSYHISSVLYRYRHLKGKIAINNLPDATPTG